MSEIEVVLATVEKVRARIRWQRTWKGLWLGLLAGAGLWAAILILYKLLPLPPTCLTIGGSGALLLIIFFSLRGWLKPISQREAARWMDQNQELGERVSTALEMQSSDPRGTWWNLVLHDAISHIRNLEPGRVLPFRLPRFYLWILLLLAVGAGLGFVPEYRSKAVKDALREKEIVKDAGRHLSDLVHQSLLRHPPAMEKTSKTVETVAELGQKMSNGMLTRADALKELTKVADQIRQELKNTAPPPSLKPVRDGARSSEQSSGTPSPEAQKQMDAMQKAMEEKGMNADSLKEMRDKLAAARQAGQGLDGKSGEGAARARQQLGEQLANISKSLGNMGQNLPELQEAIQALQNSQTDLFLKDLDLATVELDKMKALAEGLASQQSASERMGKDLEEQLKLGQAESAQQRLQQMISELQNKNLSAADMKKLLDEVKRSIDPGQQYGKAGEYLQRAANSLTQGDKTAAGQGLSDAARELENLIAQARDSKAMAASLAALDKAGQCVGSELSWSQCNGRKAGKGGNSGRGVGTWADEDNWFFNPTISQYVDNSDIKRPDTTPRGQTDRVDGELPENLVPTKLRGKFSPGGPMPSITLKGVSIKGQSSVAFREAATAAQTEAQSALNQDQVPHAYQGAVKDYFDDLKK